MGCPASLAAERGTPSSESKYAQEGTAAHAVSEMLLRTHNPSWAETRPPFSRLAAVDYIGEIVEDWRISEDMAAPIQEYVNTVLAMAQGKTLHVEQRVDFSHVVGVAGSFGTADAVIVDGDELQVHDLKFGQGVKVDAANNPQLMIYALGALRVFEIGADFNTVRLFIHQPRLNHVSEWAITVAELEAFAEEARAAAEEAVAHYEAAERGVMPPASAYRPSEKACKWCRRAPTCAAYAQHVYNEVAGEFVDLDAAEFDACRPQHLTEDQLVQAHRNITLIEAWCDKVRKEVYARLLNGGGLPGLKMVKGRDGARKWTDEREAEAALLQLEESGDVYTRKLLSPTQAEKLFKSYPAWEQVQALIVRPAGAPVVVSEEDPRPAVSLNPVDDFSVVE